ncbi:MAG TPA: hypothetical protein VMC80_02610 [Patescibacteria group bacterium]|nr:hypothetical protein [Patescibacteria group bacterium]
MDETLYEYRFRLRDLIPIRGLIEHHQRSVNEMFRNHWVGDEDYVAQAAGRDGLLVLYNMAVAAGALTGLDLIISHLVK